jgi:hypothetical protein
VFTKDTTYVSSDCTMLIPLKVLFQAYFVCVFVRVYIHRGEEDRPPGKGVKGGRR